MAKVKSVKTDRPISDEDLEESSLGAHGVTAEGDVKTGGELDVYISEVADTVRVGLDQSIAILTPWFFNNMPRIYYQTTPRPEKVRHLSAIITGHVFETKQTVELWDRDRTKVTFIGPGGERKILLDMASKLTPHPLKMGALYFSRDKLLFLSTFFCSNYAPLDRSNQRIMEKIAASRKEIESEFPSEPDLIDSYLSNLDNEFVTYATPARVHLTYRMVRHMRGHEGAHTFLEPIEGSTTARLTLGMKNANSSEVLEQVFHLVNRYDFNIGRAFVVKFEHGLEDPITIMHFIITPMTTEKIDPHSVTLMRLNKALRTLGWVDTDEYSTFMQAPYTFSINAVNLVRGIASWIHVMLGKQNPYYYSQYKIRTTFFKFHEITRETINLFRIKFDPLMAQDRNAGKYDQARQDLLAKVNDIVDEIERNVFIEAVRFVDNLQKTNYFLPTKTGLAFRLDPAILDPKFYAEKPFGIFFIIGRGYRFFHVRWKDIARGGLRVVMPRNPTEYDYALAGLFDEVYGLSFAQQLKNKDIPEGGSKAVLLLRTNGHRHQAVRGAVNALLDLLVSEDESHEEDVDSLVRYYDREEIIYLGPDENITNDLIEWIPAQAERRGYRYAAAFMSSKPDAGINHKEYGVTSEGLNVYVDNIIRYLGKDPTKEPFTVKITGGPDGDVAGNEMKILHREYGENARVVAVADGFGAAYDPNGLAWPELMRLFKAGEPIANFSAKCLSGKDAFVIKADTPENIRTRNELHFKVPAEIFIPAGGRPYTVNDKNWDQFLDKNGKPTCRAIVEGANIFFTTEARKRLQEQGVLVIKDSSANKCGVICSSYEIIASLTLSTEEFLAIKAPYVEQVIVMLRNKADSEGKLLMREYSRLGTRKTLVDLSMDISREINEVTDALLTELTRREKEVLEDDFFKQMILDHCPKILVEKYRDRIFTRLPAPHRIAILSAYIASYIVYREGLGWLERIPGDERFRAALTYMQQDRLTQALISTVEASNLPNRDKITSILRMSAARDLTILEMGGHSAN